ncbi:hypothetical protein G6F68_014092 [Rhizopus microsporus]|nr:hypothetical protein G6F68_014092 [Rhizopus microsporus]
MQVQAPLAAIAQRCRELLGQPCGVDHHLAHAERGQAFKMPDDQRLAGHVQQWCGRMQGQRAHALAEACGKDQRLHRATRIGTASSASAGLMRSSSSCCSGASSRGPCCRDSAGGRTGRGSSRGAGCPSSRRRAGRWRGRAPAGRQYVRARGTAPAIRPRAAAASSGTHP